MSDNGTPNIVNSNSGGSNNISLSEMMRGYREEIRESFREVKDEIKELRHRVETLSNSVSVLNAGATTNDGRSKHTQMIIVGLLCALIGGSFALVSAILSGVIPHYIK